MKRLELTSSDWWHGHHLDGLTPVAREKMERALKALLQGQPAPICTRGEFQMVTQEVGSVALDGQELYMQRSGNRFCLLETLDGSAFAATAE